MTSSDLIDLSGPWGRVLSGTLLHHPQAMQSMAVDPVTRDVYIVQLRDATTAPAAGNLCVNRVSQRTGLFSEHMHLDGFGHGYQIGAQHINGKTYLWTEAGPVQGGFGTHVTRFPFLAGETLTMTSTALSRPFQPEPGAYNCAPSVDPIHGWVTIRYRTAKGYFYSRYPIDSETGKVTGRAARTIPHPSKTAAPRTWDTFQGFASLGDILYLYTGDPEPPAPSGGNTHMTAISWTDGKVVAGSEHITAVPGLARREPEGLAIEPMGDEARLLFGFSGGDTMPRKATICFFSTDKAVQGVKVLSDWIGLVPAPGTPMASERQRLRGRLVNVAGTTLLQLRGTLSRDLSSDGKVAQLPPSLVPSRAVRANVPCNMDHGRGVCRVEVNAAGELWAFGATARSRISWIDFDSFSVPWL
ncbi:phage baseplate protein [Nonomuraea roseola]|uniref:P68 RBP/TagC-like beta-propeller domain-containing protein n=1 Tax=Nonomuraea roseola TaxID=46179 RepID=A0ABV5Q3G5_9ACTN